MKTTKKELGITPGRWTVLLSPNNKAATIFGRSQDGLDSIGIAEVRLPLIGLSDHYTEKDIKKMKANAAIIAEAGTVANETGKTPRQLAEENKMLLEALKMSRNILALSSLIDKSGNVEQAFQQAESAIAKAEGRAV